MMGDNFIFSKDFKEVYARTIDNLFRNESGNIWVIKRVSKNGKVKLDIIARLPLDKNEGTDYVLDKINSDPKNKKYYDYILKIKDAKRYLK